MNTYYILAMAAVELCSKDKYILKPVAFQNHVISVEYPDKNGELYEVCQLALFACSITVNIKIDGSTKCYAKLVDGPGNVHTLVNYIKRCKDAIVTKTFFKSFGFSEGIVFNVAVDKGKVEMDLNGEAVTLQELKQLRDAYKTVGNISMMLMKDNNAITKDELEDVINYTEEKLRELTKHVTTS